MQFSKKEVYLRKKDHKLKELIDTNGHIIFKANKENQFNSLVDIIISQFISTKAAYSISNKIKSNFSSKILHEKHFKRLTIKDIKKLGLSENKAKSIKELSNLFLETNSLNLEKLDYISILNSIFGIGPWSINMFEIFCLGKFDIFSSKDAGLRLAMNNLNMVNKNSGFYKYDEYAKKWKPYRSIASIHLWKMVD